VQQGRAARAKLAGGLVLILLSVVSMWGLPQSGSFLILREPLEQVDAIVVLAGNAPNRLPHGLRLYREGYARFVVVSDENVRTHGMDLTWSDVYRAGLSAPELPEEALVVLRDPLPTSTLDEAERTALILRDRNWRSAILVTDPFHSRRAALMFRAKYARHGLHVISSPAEVDELNLDHWWQHPRTATHVLEEWTKLVSYLPTGAYW
jgi:uncharacterized SAM-binding protein YcdF (DUF218 family)